MLLRGRLFQAFGDKIKIIFEGGFSIPFFCAIMPTELYYDGDV
jgi:hypothetical protein